MTIQPGERNILFMLAIGALAERTGSDAETAEDQLDGGHYDIRIQGDQDMVILTVNDEILVRASRDWLKERDGYQPGEG